MVAQLHKTIAAFHVRMREAGTEYPEVEMAKMWRETLTAPAESGLPVDAGGIDLERLAVEYESRVNPVWPMPSALECLRSLRQRGLILGIVSNAQFFTPLAWTAVCGQSLEQMGVATSMQFLSYQHHQAKPGDYLYLQARASLSLMGVSGGETLYIGNDMRNDILPAFRTGFVTALFAGDRRSLRLREDDPEIAGLQPDIVVTDLLQILDVVPAGPRLTRSMTPNNLPKIGHNIGFVGTRFSGTDGVSLEASKWAQILWDHRHVSYWYGGKLDTHPDISMLVPHAHFNNPDIEWINQRVFGRTTREQDVTRRIYALSDYLKGTLYEFTRRFQIEILVVQNASCIPMNVPLGLAIANFIAETGFPTIAHHHDFYWERDRFSVNAIGDFLSMAFPPLLPSIQHVTINSAAQRALSHRCGCSSQLIPNVLDFENPPSVADEFSRNFRHDLGLEPDDIVFLQPTRVVPRKGIEHAIALLAALDNPKCKLIVTHESGDEGNEYMHALQEMAEHQGVDLRFVSHRVGDIRHESDSGDKTYDLADAYVHSDFITYPSLYEGFGNALLEAFYHRKPVLVNRYSIFVTDIEPKNFKVIKMNGYLTKEVVERVKRVLDDPLYREEMVNHNYELSKAFFSYTVLRRKLRALITNFTGMDDL